MTIADQHLLTKLVSAWPARAAVRNMDLSLIDAAQEAALPDYPEAMLPFRDHPLYLRCPPAKRNAVLTFSWLAYNARVIQIEERVTNPAIDKILKGEIPGGSTRAVRQALQQTQIDEQFHLHLHEIAVDKTMKLRGIASQVEFPESVIYRELIALRQTSPESWQRDLLTLVWAAVSEMTINAYLDLLAEDATIQPLHAYVCKVHNRDEYAHNKIFVSIVRGVFEGLDPAGRKFLATRLPLALDVFAGQDFSVWTTVLQMADVADAEVIIADVASDASTTKLLSDVSAARRLIAEFEAALL